MRVRHRGLVSIDLPLGVHGAAALAPNGTEAALVGTIAFVPGAAAPTLFLAGLIGAVRPLNVGRRSCARYHLLPPKTKKKRR